ncbi:Cerato-platanin [Fomitiporia mediterranea MF3/22]|uniref:Cerato-platanin n=1 Tax=Fomitiporia mediterranea (strain MF3/22) TaxID=694068 RepID=UPI0004408AAD|nr:Cerato-platanin [Fomitiporia mediterranea MF3/22]EJD08293.1 Cerato-platanin [Fomitiporia mediterranea MF3/22]
MKLATLSAIVSLFTLGALADQVTFDPVYDNANQSLATVECSTGSNGLLTRNFTTFGSLPTFPFIGGASAIAGFNSANCGSCWNITFNGTSIVVTAIDFAGSGFNIGEIAMNNLTNGQAEQVGVVQATALQLNASACGL